jgi:hypothetical protein
MALLSDNDVKAELSYAYLHAVSASCGFGCQCADRHTDSAGVDAVIRVKERFSQQSTLTEFTLEIQLKATSQELAYEEERFSLSMKTAHYDKLRKTDIVAPRYLAVLMMPQDRKSWLSLDAEQLICRKCVRWISLRNAAAVTTASTTVYLPQSNVLSPEALRKIAELASMQEWVNYEP